MTRKPPRKPDDLKLPGEKPKWKDDEFGMPLQRPGREESGAEESPDPDEPWDHK